MSNKNILMLACINPAQSNAGTLHVCGIANGFSDLGYKVTILLPSPAKGETASLSLRDDVVVRYFRAPRIPNAFKIFFAIPALISEFCRKPALFYTRHSLFNAFALALSRLWGLVSVTEHNGLIGEEMVMLGQTKFLAPLGDWMQRMDCRCAHKVSIVTPELKARLVAAGVPGDKIFVSGNGTDMKIFRPLDRMESLRKLGLDPSRNYIGFIGTLAEWQGVSWLIEGFSLLAAKYPGWDVIVVGSGPQLQPLKDIAKAKDLESRIHFTGHMALPGVPGAINCFDIGTSPAIIRRNAGIGLSTIKIRDYAATGRAILAARLPGNDVFERLGFMMCHTPENTADIAANLEKLMNDPALRQALGDKALAYARDHFDWSYFSRQALEEARIIPSRG